MAICPAGHTSAAEDYCDICGLPVSSGPAAAPAPVTPLPGALCPHCGTNNAPDALFCEACGYDFTTGTMPRTASPATPPPSSWGGAPTASAWETLPDAPSPDASAPDASAPDAPAAPDAAAPPDVAAPSSPDAVASTAAADAAAPSPALTAPPPHGPPTQVIPANAGIPVPARDDARGAGNDESPAGPSPAPPPAVTPPSRRPLQARPSGLEWVAEVWIDPDWYATQGSTDALPSPGLPDVVPLRANSALIGRTSRSRNIHPDIDCELDSGVSRRHAQVSTDGNRWWIEDLESANGTFIGPSAGPLPTDPIGRGRVEFAPDQRIYLGAWTRIVVRAATDDEKQAFSA